ncbi:MAG: CPBP family glutamic-type intramembrane protease [Armatimonadota bacterium]|nr:CPBP family glutamic-type intramembrane protease [Armatimonadota bacterium]
MSFPFGGPRRPTGYYELSRTLTYSVVAVLPLLVLYEAGVWFINLGSPTGVRNAADVALKQPFLLLGPHGPHLFVVGLLLAGLAIFRYEARPKRIQLVRAYFVLMVAESLIYAFFFGAAVNGVLRALLRPFALAAGMERLDFTARLVLSLGAGIYEELVFRVILVSALFLFLRPLMRATPAGVYAAAAVLGALLFSGFHYVGPFGDAFQLNSFLYRFVAGLLLNVLYLARGFGIAVYTHAFYDVLVTLMGA